MIKSKYLFTLCLTWNNVHVAAVPCSYDIQNQQSYRLYTVYNFNSDL